MTSQDYKNLDYYLIIIIKLLEDCTLAFNCDFVTQKFVIKVITL